MIILRICVQAALEFSGRRLALHLSDGRFGVRQRSFGFFGVAAPDLTVQRLNFALRLAQSIARGRRARRLVQLHLQLVRRRFDGVHARTIAIGRDHHPAAEHTAECLSENRKTA